MNVSYIATISPATTPDASFNSVKGLPVGPADAGALVADNTPTVMENNQNILKNLPFSWWAEGLSSDSIQYRPVSGEVNWAVVVGGEDVYISRDLSDAVIPNRTDTVTRDEVAKTVSVRMKDNGCLVLTAVHKGMF
jgi:hypothetical protein